MKIFIVALLNFFANPILFIKYLKWAERLKSINFKRKQYILLGVNYTFTFLNFTLREKLNFAELTSIIFEVDTYIDNLSRKDFSAYKHTLDNLIDNDKFNYLFKDFFAQFTDSQKLAIGESFEEWIISSYKFDNLKFNSIEQFLGSTYTSMGVACLANMISESTGYQDENYEEFIKLCSEVLRIVNDHATKDKDLKEKRRNIFLEYKKDDINEYMKSKLQIYRSIKKENKYYKYMSRLVSIVIKLYRNGDFEL